MLNLSKQVYEWIHSYEVMNAWKDGESDNIRNFKYIDIIILMYLYYIYL